MIQPLIRNPSAFSRILTVDEDKLKRNVCLMPIVIGLNSFRYRHKRRDRKRAGGEKARPKLQCLSVGAVLAWPQVGTQGVVTSATEKIALRTVAPESHFARYGRISSASDTSARRQGPIRYSRD